MFKLRNLYLKRSLLVIYIAFVLISGFIITNLIILNTSKEVLRQELINEKLPLISQRIYSEIKLDLLPYLIVSSRLANDKYIIDWVAGGEQNEEDLVAYLDKVRKEYNASTCFVAYEKTKAYYNSKGEICVESEGLPEAAWYYSFKKSGKDVDLDVSLDIDNTPTIFIDVKMTDSEGDFHGIAGLGIELIAIPKILSEYKDNYHRNIFFTNKKGDIIASSNDYAENLKNIYNLSGVKDELKSIYSGEKSYFEYKVGNKDFLISSKSVPELGWWIFVEQEETGAFKTIDHIIWENSLINLISILVTLILVIFAVNFYHKKLNEMATIDSLTGIGNRQIFEYIINKSLDKFRRTKEPLSIILMDLDYFKAINDTLGHLEGDEILKIVVLEVKKVITSSDDFCRWGGEEFVVLSHNCDLAQAIALADKIRNVIENSKELRISDEIRLTVSIGVSEACNLDTSDSLINRADNALYEAKKKGRNCVVHNM